MFIISSFLNFPFKNIKNFYIKFILILINIFYIASLYYIFSVNLPKIFLLDLITYIAYSKRISSYIFSGNFYITIYS